jgi:hypothetical protein
VETVQPVEEEERIDGGILQRVIQTRESNSIESSRKDVLTRTTDKSKKQ